LIASVPKVDPYHPLVDCPPLAPEAQQWLGRAGALILASSDAMEIAMYRAAALGLNMSTSRWQSVQDIVAILYRLLAVAELRAPVAARGAFIPAGNAFDAMAAVGKVLTAATGDVLIVDPYMDEKALTDFAPLAPEGVAIRLMADEQHHKPTLAPAQRRWISQFGGKRPLTVRLATPRSLHDRLIVVDSAESWVLTQSLNAFAARSPAAIVRADRETSALKIGAYQEMWGRAKPI
jgi:hypothetical protein